jgi:hypothetical protein
MEDPVIVPESGFTYERAHIEAWLRNNMCASSQPRPPRCTHKRAAATTAAVRPDIFKFPYGTDP